jgi:hypothetical protein
VFRFVLHSTQQYGFYVETKEAREMRRNWLRGTLLGLSLALVLAGGAVLAQGLSVTPDQDCFECWSRDAGWPPPDDHILELTVNGYDVGEYLCAQLTIAGEIWGEDCWTPAQEPPCFVGIAVMCETMELYVGSNCWDAHEGEALGGDVAPSQDGAVYGDWLWTQWQEDDGVTAGPVYASFRFAEVCEEEFVPEPGSILLLGSGLAGLAGYATLRWRTRE